MIYLIFVLSVLIFSLTFGYFAYSTAKSFTKPDSERQYRVYVDYYIQNLPRKDITVKTDDNLNIKGWLFENKLKCGVILVHGIRANRSILNNLVKFYFDKGFTVLSIDLRNHGESDKSNTTLGYKERLDVEASANFLKEMGCKTVIAHGISMGAVACILAKIEKSNLIDVVIADSPYLSLEESSRYIFKKFPDFLAVPFSKISLFIGKQLTGIDTSMLNIKKNINEINGNIFFIFSEYDPFTDIEKIKNILKNKELWIVENTWHGLAFKWYPELYQKKIYDFICKKTKCCIS